MRSLLPYQARWVRDTAGQKVIEKSRRIGISWAEAYDAVLHAGLNHGGGNVYYQSYAYDMAAGFINDCAEWAEILEAGAAAADEVLVELDDRTTIQTHRLRLASGHEILAMTSAPRAFRSRGRPGDRAIIDEAAFVDDLREVLKAARAFRMWGGEVHVISTHNGADNPFAALVRDVGEGRAPGTLHRVTLRDACREGLAGRSLAVQGKPADEAACAECEQGIRDEYGEFAGEELDCVPSQGSGAWLAWDWIRACEGPADAGAWAQTDTGRVWLASKGLQSGEMAWIGIDIARRVHLWVAAVVAVRGRERRLVELVEARNLPFSRQGDVVRRLLYQWAPPRVAVDQTGIGEAVVETWKGRFGQLRIEGVLMSGARRLDVATALREVVEDTRLAIPPDDRLRADLHAIRRVATPTGTRLVAPDSGESHADRFWALALACAAAAAPAGEFDYRAVRPPRDGDEDDDGPGDRWGAWVPAGARWS